MIKQILFAALVLGFCITMAGCGDQAQTDGPIHADVKTPPQKNSTKAKEDQIALQTKKSNKTTRQQSPESNDNPPTNSSLEHALVSIFNPVRAPGQKTMGPLQRTFLDLVETDDTKLQVAFVIDGTDSMTADLTGVSRAIKDLANDLQQYKGNEVNFALVVFRDIGAKSGPISIPHKQFVSLKTLQDGLSEHLQAESGAPYFLELTDLGIHAAMDQLPWSTDEKTSRLMMVFGDAPPYDANVAYKETEAKRHYADDILIDRANKLGIKINCILCKSDLDHQPAFEKVHAKMQRFMNNLATGTGGLMLDLSHDDIRIELAKSAKRPRVDYQRIKPITRDDLEAERNKARQAKSDRLPSKRIKLAVLPHQPFREIDFNPDEPAVQVAAELRQKFRRFPRTQVAGPIEVEDALKQLIDDGIADREILSALSIRLRVDYVVWGTLDEGEQVVSSIFAKSTGRDIVQQVSIPTEGMLHELGGRLSRQLVDRMMKTAEAKNVAPDLWQTYSVAFADDNFQQTLIAPVARTSDSHQDLMAGMDWLERALAFESGSDQSKPMLDTATSKLTAVIEADPNDAFAHWLLASSHFNMAQFHFQNGDKDQHKKAIEDYRSALKTAYREKDENVEIENIRLEIEADYKLLVDRRKQAVDESIEAYEKLTGTTNNPVLHSALRAHWMLAGIYSGDWGVDRTDVDKARSHIIKILAYWPDSSEAQFFKKNLRWNDLKGKTQFDNVPQQNNPVVDLGV